MKIKVIYSNVIEDKHPEVIEIEEEDLHEIYRLLNCDAIDIVRRRIGDNMYRIIVDDLGLLKPNPLLSSFSLINRDAVLVGNLIIAGMEDFEGRLTSLTEKNIKEIASSFIEKIGSNYKILLQSW